MHKVKHRERERATGESEKKDYFFSLSSRAEPSNPKGIPYTTASEESMWLVPQLTAFHQSQAEKRFS